MLLNIEHFKFASRTAACWALGAEPDDRKARETLIVLGYEDVDCRLTQKRQELPGREFRKHILGDLVRDAFRGIGVRPDLNCQDREEFGIRRTTTPHSHRRSD